MKKIVVLGGGNGQSVLLRGLKQVPFDLTSIVSVCDDGKSTGRLRKEFHTPAVGDLRRVLISLADTEPLMEQLFQYRFQTTSDLNDHALGNLMLTAMIDLTGNLTEGIASLSKVFHLKGRVLPFSEESATLMAKMTDGTIVEGEHLITDTGKIIEQVFYKEPIHATKEVLDALKEADYIVLSMGSLYTSILPNLLCHEVLATILKSQAKLLYVCNMMTQPGETDHFTVSDHIHVLNRYLAPKTIDTVFVNTGPIAPSVMATYQVKEQKDPVLLDREEVKRLGVTVIENDYVRMEDHSIRHNADLLAHDLSCYFSSDCCFK